MLSIVVNSALSMLCPQIAIGQPSSSARQPELLLQYGHTEEIIGTPSFSPDGKLVATIDGNREVILWDIERGLQLRRLRPAAPEAGGGTGSVSGNTEKYLKAVISPDGRLLAASGFGGAVVLELQSGRRLPFIRFWHRAFMPADIAFSPDSRLLYMADVGGNVVPYDVPTGVPQRQAESENMPFYRKYGLTKAIAASADGRFLASAGRERILASGRYSGRELFWARIVDAATGKELKLFEHDVRLNARAPDENNMTAEPVAIAFSTDGSRFALGADGVAWIYETAGWREVHRIDMKDDAAAGLAFSPDGRRLAITGSRDYSVRLVDVASGVLVRSFENPRALRREFSFIGGFSKVAFAPDGRKLIASGSRGSLRMWYVESGEAAGFLGGKTDSVRHIAARRDGKRIAVAGQLDNLVRVWNVETGNQGAIVGPHAEPVAGVALAPNGRDGISWTAAAVSV